MTIDLYSIANIVETQYDPATQTITCTWHHLGPHDHLRPCLQAQVDCVLAHTTKAIVIDTSASQGVLTQEDQAWIGEYVFPSYQSRGLKAVITVLPQSALTNMSAKRWQKTGAGFGIDFIETDSVMTAKQIVANLTS